MVSEFHREWYRKRKNCLNRHLGLGDNMKKRLRNTVVRHGIRDQRLMMKDMPADSGKRSRAYIRGSAEIQIPVCLFSFLSLVHLHSILCSSGTTCISLRWHLFLHVEPWHMLMLWSWILFSIFYLLPHSSIYNFKHHLIQESF